MEWDGKERRQHINCDQVENISTLMADQKHAMELLDKHTSHGHVWRVIIAGTITTVILNTIVFSNMYGKLTEKVDHISVDVRDNSVMIRTIANMSERLGILEEKTNWLEQIILRKEK